MNAVCKKAVPVLNYQLSDVVMFASSFQDVVYLHISPQIQNRHQGEKKPSGVKWLFPEKSKILFVSMAFSSLPGMLACGLLDVCIEQ